MILSGHQPNYIPWIGYFNKVKNSDKHVWVDNTQFNKKHVQNRNQIKSPQGPLLLSVPVLTKGQFDQNINEVQINNDEQWQKKHWKSIKYYYSGAPYFEEHEDFFHNVYSTKWNLLVDLNIHIINYLLKEFDIKTQVALASEHNLEGHKNDLIIILCQGLGADTYLSGQGAKKYVDEDYLKKNEINHIYQDFKHPVYPQQYGEFISNLSAIDLLFNTGPDAKNYI